MTTSHDVVKGRLRAGLDLSELPTDKVTAPAVHAQHIGAFGNDRFGQAAERAARFFGTPQYIIGQSLVVVAWILVNCGFIVGNALGHRFDPYPFILLNLAFSTQAAYAAPLILLASSRQADRDKHLAESEQAHREEIARQHREALFENTQLTKQVAALTAEVHKLVCPPDKPPTRRRKAQ